MNAFKFDDYRFRFNPEAKERFIELLKERFNSGVRYKCQRMKWDTAIEEKTSELGLFLTGKSSAIDFGDASPELLQHDERELRGRILAMSCSDARQRGIGKSILHYLRRRATERKPLNPYAKTLQRIV